MSNFRQAERKYLEYDVADPAMFGACKNCLENRKTFTALTSDYEAYIDDEKNLFCSEECAMEYHGIRGIWD